MARRLSLLRAYKHLVNEIPTVSLVLSKVPGLPEHVAQEIEQKIGKLDDKSSLQEIHRKIVYHYLCWRLQATPEQMDRIMAIYFRIRNKSVALMAQSIDMLINELGFKKEKVCNKYHKFEVFDE